jgi:hypothetical protein
MGVLRNQLYSDKVLAVVREYTCNAVDANVEAGTGDTPITVTLPNRMNPYFKVRDDGFGLTGEDISDIYAFYGESTKRNSNDQIGMLGIGSKAAFAYGDNFVINSYVGGKKVMYNAYIDESQRGQISSLGEEDTTQPDGVEIVVPVRADDYQEFQDTAKNLFKWFKLRPVVKGCQDFKYEEQQDELFSGTGWRWFKSSADNRWGRSSDAYIVMGNIGYPIDSNALNLKGDDYEDYNSLLCDSLVIDMEIGDVEISASREKLQFTDYTRKNIIAKLATVKDELLNVVNKEFADSKTLFDAKCLMGELFDYGSGLYSLRDVLLKSVKWNGKPITNEYFELGSYNDSLDGLALSQAKKFGYTGKYRMEERIKIDCKKGVVVILNDVGHRRSLMGRVYPLTINQNKDVYMIEAKDCTNTNGTVVKGATALSKWKKASKFDAKMLKLSELPLHKLSEFGFAPAASGYGGGDKDEKHSKQCFKYDWKAADSLRSWHRKKADFWKPASADLDAGGVYVIIDKFEVDDLRAVSRIDGFLSLKESLDAVKIKLPDFFAFKVKSRSDVETNDKWESLDKWVERALKEMVANNQQQVANANYLNRQNFQDNVGHGLENVVHIRESRKDVLDKVLLKLTDISIFKEFWDKHGVMEADAERVKGLQNVLKLARDYTINGIEAIGVKPTYDLKPLAKKIGEKYAMLNHLENDKWGSTWRSDNLKKSAADIANYINVIDVCNASKSD